MSDGEVSAPQELSLAQVTAWLRAHAYGTTALELYHEVGRCTGVDYEPLLKAAAHSEWRLTTTAAAAARDAVHRSSQVDAGASLTSGAKSSSVSTYSIPAAGPAAVAPLRGTSSFEDAATAEHVSVSLIACLQAFSSLNGGEALGQLLREHAAELGLPDEHCRALGFTSGPTVSGGARAPRRQTGTDDNLASPSETTPTTTTTPANAATDSPNVAVLEQRARAAERQVAELVSTVEDSLTLLMGGGVDPARREALLPLLRVTAMLSTTATARAAARHALLNLFPRPNPESRLAVVAEWLRVTRTAPRRMVEQEMVPELYGLVNARAPERRLLALDCACAVAADLADAHKVRFALCQGLLRPLSEDASATVRRAVPHCLAALWGGAGEGVAEGAAPDSVMATVSGSEPCGGTASLAQQSSFPMELAVRLALDPCSNTVRHAAQAQLRQVIYPKCQRDGSLLTRFVPMLITVIGMEAGPLRADSDALDVPDGDAPAAATLPATPRPRLMGAVSGKSPFPFSATTKAPAGVRERSVYTLAHSNVAMLVKLCGDAVHCIKVALPQEAGGERASTAAVCAALLGVVLPTAYSVLPRLLDAFLTGPRARRLVGGSLCGLGAYLAALVAVLDARSWDSVRAYLIASMRDDRAGPSAESASAEAETRGRAALFYTLLIRLAGEQTAFHEGRDGAEGGPAAEADRFANVIGRQSAALILQSVTTRGTALTTDERLRTLALCLGHLGALSSREPNRVAAGVAAVLWSFAEAPTAAQRLHAVSLVSQICAQPLEDTTKTTLACPPLFVLLNDPEEAVREMAAKGLLTAAAHLTKPQAQEKVLRPGLATVEASGCTSDLTVAVLHQWEALLPTMPAEPREVFLYPQLSTLMDQLSGLQARHVLARRQLRVAAATPTHGATPIPALTPEEREAQERWERAATAVLSVLVAILRCAVVTPPLVATYLLPGIRHLASEGVLVELSPGSRLPARWLQMSQSYETFIENNSPHAVTQQAASLLDRVRDELRRRF